MAAHRANACHICGEEMENYRPPEYGSPGIGICEEHGVSYDLTYKPPEDH